MGPGEVIVLASRHRGFVQLMTSCRQR